jgi:hypothetical protein
MDEINKIIKTLDLDSLKAELESKKARLDKEGAKLQTQIDQVNALITIKNG